MGKITITKRDLFFIGILSAFAVVFTVVWMALTGNAPQVYNDIVIEWTAMVRSNKSAEILLLRLLIVFGTAAVFCYSKLFVKSTEIPFEEKLPDAAVALFAWICSLVVLKFLFFEQTSNVIFFALCLAGISFIVDKKIVVLALIQYFLSYYAVFAVYHACNFLGSYKIIKAFADMKNYGENLALIFAILLAALPLFFKRRHEILKKTVLVVQLVLPALFLVLTLKEYNFQGDTINIGIPFRAKIFVTFAILLAFGNAVYALKKSWKREFSDVAGMISIGTCISIWCFNFYGGQGAVVSGDMHHPFENIFAFQQIFQLGQIPFKDFIPPSGLYSVVHGFFFKLFGKGDVAYLSLSDQIFFFSMLATTLFLLKFHVSNLVCFAVALFLQFPNYDRVVFSSIVVLLLLLPQLVRRSNLWLKVFLLVSVFHGLYYPVYGVACSVGFIPMFVVQLRKIILDEDSSYKTVKFWLPWVFTFVVLILSLPLVLGTFVHILSMSGQSVLESGISIFGQQLPEWFMPYAANILRYPLYNAMHVVPLALVVWLSALFMTRILGEKIGRNFIFENIEIFTACISLILIPVVSYSFTFIRSDIYTFFSRSWPALIVEFFLFVVFAFKYVKNNSFRLVTLIFLNIFIVSSWGVGVEQISWKMFSKINVPGDYQLLRKDDFEFNTVGKCFLRNDFLNSLNYEKTKLAEINGQPSFAKLGSFGQWYMLKQKGSANCESFVMKGFEAARETRKMLLKNKTLVGTYIDPNTVYYLFNWLVSSGEYVWTPERNSFLPNENLSFDEARKLNKKCPLFYENYWLGNSSGVLGLSFKSLKKIFKERKRAFSQKSEENILKLNFAESFEGHDMDFVYIEFEGGDSTSVINEFNMSGEHEVKLNDEREKKEYEVISKLFLKKKFNADKVIQISFYDEDGKSHCVNADYNEGKLLVNLGVGVKYLLEKHDKVEISVLQNGVQMELPAVKEIKFLKCRQIYGDGFSSMKE